MIKTSVFTLIQKNVDVYRFILLKKKNRDLNNNKPNMRASVMAQSVKNPLAMQEAPVLSLGWEDPLEKEIATHSNILAWRIPWREEPGRLQSMGSQRVVHNLAIKPPPPPIPVCITNLM